LAEFGVGRVGVWPAFAIVFVDDDGHAAFDVDRSDVVVVAGGQKSLFCQLCNGERRGIQRGVRGRAGFWVRG
jgi:hypothetical protein